MHIQNLLIGDHEDLWLPMFLCYLELINIIRIYHVRSLNIELLVDMKIKIALPITSFMFNKWD